MKTCAEEQRGRLEAEAQVARLEGELVGYRNDLQNVREMLQQAQAANAAKDAALRQVSHMTVGRGDDKRCLLAEGPVPQADCYICAALSDQGEGWLPPEVREQTRGALRAQGTAGSLAAEGEWHVYGCGVLYGPGIKCLTRCEQARAALDRLGGT